MVKRCIPFFRHVLRSSVFARTQNHWGRTVNHTSRCMETRGNNLYRSTALQADTGSFDSFGRRLASPRMTVIEGEVHSRIRPMHLYEFADDWRLATDDWFQCFFLPARAMRSSIGLRPAKPSSGECQCVILSSPSFQQSNTISPSTRQGKSSNPMSMSFTCTPVA